MRRSVSSVSLDLALENIYVTQKSEVSALNICNPYHKVRLSAETDFTLIYSLLCSRKVLSITFGTDCVGVFIRFGIVMISPCFQMLGFMLFE